MARHEQFDVQLADAVGRRDEAERRADLVAADRVEVRQVAEYGAEQVSGEHRPLVGEPDDQGVGGLPARRREQLEAPAAELERVVVLEQEVRHWVGRLLGHVAPLAEHAAPQHVGSPSVELGESVPVAAHLGVVRLRDDLGVGSRERARAADVVAVALGEDHDLPGGVVNLREALGDGGPLEGQAGVDQDVSVGRDQEVSVGHALRGVDPFGDRGGRGLPIACQDQRAEVGLPIRSAHAALARG